MKLPGIRSEVTYWDEGNKNNYEWFRKGWWKRHLKKKFIRKCFKVDQLE